MKDRIYGTEAIAAGGTGRRTGNTHTTLELATFLKKEGFTCAILELLHSTGSPGALHTLETQNKTHLNLGFAMDGIDVFPTTSMDVYIQILSSGYQYVS